MFKIMYCLKYWLNRNLSYFIFYMICISNMIWYVFSIIKDAFIIIADCYCLNNQLYEIMFKYSISIARNSWPEPKWRYHIYILFALILHRALLKCILMRIAAQYSCQICIPEIEYYQKVSSHAQVWPQGAEKQLRKVNVVGGGGCTRQRPALAPSLTEQSRTELQEQSLSIYIRKIWRMVSPI